MTQTFEDMGGKTKLTWRMLHLSAGGLRKSQSVRSSIATKKTSIVSQRSWPNQLTSPST